MKVKAWGLFVALVSLFGQTSTNGKKTTLKAAAVGKEAVLDFMEKDALQRTGGKPGVYRVYTDDAGGVQMLIIAGHAFTGTFSASGAQLPSSEDWNVERGIVTSITNKK